MRKPSPVYPEAEGSAASGDHLQVRGALSSEVEVGPGSTFGKLSDIIGEKGVLLMIPCPSNPIICCYIPPPSHYRETWSGHSTHPSDSAGQEAESLSRVLPLCIFGGRRYNSITLICS